MEDEDSYSYLGIPAPLGSPLARAQIQSSCLQKRSFQELYNHLAILHYLKTQPAFPTQKRVKPPVPKFEDSYKKLKTENVEQSTANRLSSVDINSFTESRGFEPICRNHISDAANKAKETQLVPEPSFIISELVPNTLFKESEPEAAKMDHFSLFSVKIEEGDDVKTEAPSSEGHSSLGSPESPEMAAATSSHASLDRKDMKKFQKFVELCDDYQKKLNIQSNHEVTEKFKRLATLVIPKLLSHFKSKPFESVAAAILLYACREVNYPITLKQIVSISDSKEKLINKCVFTLKEILPQDTEVKHFKAGEFIKVMADKLKLTEQVRAGAVKIWENIERLNFMKSIHAMTLAACCLKFACSLSESDKEFETLAVAAGITKMTLKNMYRELFPYRFYFITADCMLGDPKDLKIL
jgi:hypothetical protein